MPVGVLAAVAVIGTVVNVVQSNRARKEQKRANEVAQRQEKIRAQHARSEAIASNRITAATVFAQAANQGVAGSTGVAGSLGAFGTQAAAGLSLTNQLDSLEAQRLAFLDKANRLEYSGAIAGQVASAARSGMPTGG